MAVAPEFQALRAKIAAGDSAVLAELQALPIRDAELVLAGCLEVPAGKSKAAVTARSLIVQLPGIGDHYRKMLKNNLDQRQRLEIGAIFHTMVSIDPVESVGMIVPYLFATTYFEGPAGKMETPVTLVREAAMQTLHKMKLPDSPTKKRRSLGGSADIRLWQQWWKENQWSYIRPQCGWKATPLPKPAALPVTPAPFSHRLTLASMPVVFTARPLASGTLLPRFMEIPLLELSSPATGMPVPTLLSTEPPPPNWYPLAAAVALLLALGCYYQFRRRIGPRP